MTLDDVAEFGLTKGQNKLLSKAVSELKAPDLPPKLADPKPVTTTSLAKDQDDDDILKKLDNGGELAALLNLILSCCYYILIHENG